jgi:6-phosphogluconolactonase
MMMQAQIEILPDPEHLAIRSVELFVAASCSSIADHGCFSVTLSGGNTPRRTYELLAEPRNSDRIMWDKVHVFWGDERNVPPDHPDSNYLTACSTLLDHVPIPSINVHRIEIEKGPVHAAQDYESTLRRYFETHDVTCNRPGTSCFDLVLLGLGDDGHTASLFPGSPSLDSKQWVVAEEIPNLASWRISLTPLSINSARMVVFLVSGDTKASILKNVLKSEYRPSEFPAQNIQPVSGNVIWLIDSDAARLII